MTHYANAHWRARRTRSASHAGPSSDPWRACDRAGALRPPRDSVALAGDRTPGGARSARGRPAGGSVAARRSGRDPARTRRRLAVASRRCRRMDGVSSRNSPTTRRLRADCTVPGRFAGCVMCATRCSTSTNHMSGGPLAPPNQLVGPTDGAHLPRHHQPPSANPRLVKEADALVGRRPRRARRWRALGGLGHGRRRCAGDVARLVVQLRRLAQAVSGRRCGGRLGSGSTPRGVSAT